MKTVSCKPCKIRGFLPRIYGNRDKSGGKEQIGRIRKGRKTGNVSWNGSITHSEKG
jgi:hypothetical protein